MKRPIFTLIGTLLTVALFAQKPATKIVLAKGQKIVATTTVSIVSNSMGMDGTTNSSTENSMEVKLATGKDYTISNKLTKIKFSTEGPGMTTSYDSEKKEDQETEMGKSMSEKLNKLSDVIIDDSGVPLNDPKPQPKKDEEADASPMASLFKMVGENGSDEAIVSGAFQLIPADKKPGDSWSDSSLEGDIKVRRTYNFKSSADSGAVIQLIAKAESTGTIPVMGMTMEVSTTTETTSEILFDIATGLVKRKSTESNAEGSFQVMGQTVPFTAKSTTVSIYK